MPFTTVDYDPSCFLTHLSFVALSNQFSLHDCHLQYAGGGYEDMLACMLLN